MATEELNATRNEDGSYSIKRTVRDPGREVEAAVAYAREERELGYQAGVREAADAVGRSIAQPVAEAAFRAGVEQYRELYEQAFEAGRQFERRHPGKPATIAWPND